MAQAGSSVLGNNALSLSKFGFGVEVEAVVQPWRVRAEWRDQPQLYYERLALALRNRGLNAVADDLTGTYQAQHAEHYDKWFITRDGSIQGTADQGKKTWQIPSKSSS